MADISSLINYYVNLLIVEYRNQPKAQAHIALLAGQALASGVMLDVMNAYNINGDNPAVGKQLDVIGKYVGLDRYYSGLNLNNMFSLVTYGESLPSSPPRWGFTTYANFSNYNYNGTLVYDKVISSENALLDADFLTLIKLKIVQNNSNYSYESIDTSLWQFFGSDLRAESNGNMHMVFFVSGTITPLIDAMIKKDLFPLPLGVDKAIVNNVNGQMFAFSSYQDYQLNVYSPYGHGFVDYAHFSATPGQVLLYDNIG